MMQTSFVPGYDEEVELSSHTAKTGLDEPRTGEKMTTKRQMDLKDNTTVDSYNC